MGNDIGDHYESDETLALTQTRTTGYEDCEAVAEGGKVIVIATKN